MNDLSCPYCASNSIRLLDAMFTVRLVERPEGGGISIKMWIVSGVLIVVATILGVIGIRVKTTRL
jgi:hypothetical protein